MVGKILSLFSKQIGGLHEAAFLLGLSAFASQLLGLIRDRLLAGQFGAGELLDVYYGAFRLPDLIYVSIASFVSVTVLIPFILEGLNRDDKAGVKKMLDQLFTLFTLVMVGVSVIAFFLLPFLVDYLAPGFSVEQQTLLVTLSRIMLLSPFLLGLSNLLGSVTQGLNKFFIYALSPICYNLGIIFGVIFFYPNFGLVGLAWGVVLGALGHLLVQWPALRQAGLSPHWRLPYDWKLIRRIIGISLPRTITLGAHQFSLMMLIALGSTLSVGAITVFNFAWNLQSVPLAIVGVSYSVAAFPALSRLFVEGDQAAFLNHIRTAFRHIVFWSVLAMVFFIVLRAQVVRVILGAGNFGWTETRLVAAALALFAISVVAQGLVLLFVRGYYAAGRTLTPFLINTGSSLLIIVLAFNLKQLFLTWPVGRYFLESLLRVSDIEGTMVLILPLAFSLGLIVNLLSLMILFTYDFGRLGRPVWRAGRQVVTAAIFGGFVSYQALNILARGFDLNTFSGIFLQGLGAGVIGLLSTFALLAIMDNKELGELSRTLRHKFWRSTPIAPEPVEL
ncbi:MAG: hypothetical protein KBC48_01090 [Candidatus Pacebacteria bacterium]|nr:hypothetical protein [Candidatus Paceibacterota bacterium]